jgi:hypothetical protein
MSRRTPLPFGWLLDGVVYLDRHSYVQETLDIGGEYTTETGSVFDGPAQAVGVAKVDWEGAR